jgi:quercetin dioxygenase-like cupin family protein
MKIVRLHEASAQERSDAVRKAFMGRNVVSCGTAEFAPGTYAHEGERHFHEHDEVFIILTGEITVPIKDGPAGVARAGDWVLVKAGEEHHLTNHTHLPCVAMYLILAEQGA